jgi:serine kinase of HPr protein (carbohydrate metabolism regulator)
MAMTASVSQCVHATCVDIGGAGLLLFGSSGAGKSDLALRLIDTPGYGIGDTQVRARLVADDQVVVRAEAGTLVAAPPPSLAGQLEVRGLGIVKVPHKAETRLVVAVQLVARETIERLPDLTAEQVAYCGLHLPLVRIFPFEVSAPVKLRALVATLMSGTGTHHIHNGDAGHSKQA